VVATGGNRSQIVSTRKRLNKPKPLPLFATGCRRQRMVRRGRRFESVRGLCKSAANARFSFRLRLQTAQRVVGMEPFMELSDLPVGADRWLGRLYQSANRLAHLYFLRELAGVQAWLLHTCFINDVDHVPVNEEAWRRALEEADRELEPCRGISLRSGGVPTGASTSRARSRHLRCRSRGLSQPSGASRWLELLSRPWPLRSAGGRWAGRPGSLRPSGWLASRPGQALCPGRCRGIAACPGR
jgi:hypothetical protein